MQWRHFRLCFAAAPDGWVRREAGWVAYHEGSWWVKRHHCKDESLYQWVRAKTRAGCVRFLARAVLQDLKHDPTDGVAFPAWPAHVKVRAERALELGGRIFGGAR
jgi:hypothetical protein